MRAHKHTHTRARAHTNTVSVKGRSAYNVITYQKQMRLSPISFKHVSRYKNANILSNLQLILKMPNLHKETV